MAYSLHGIIFREVHSSATKSNFKMTQVLYRHCLGTEKRICSNTLYSSSSSPTYFPYTPQNNYSHLSTQLSFLLSASVPVSSTFLPFLPSYTSFPCRATQLLELSSTSFFPLIILLIYYSPCSASPSPKKQSGIYRTLLARGRLRGRRESCEHMPVRNFHSVYVCICVCVCVYIY